MIRELPRATLFPYTPLFRSLECFRIADFGRESRDLGQALCALLVVVRARRPLGEPRERAARPLGPARSCQRGQFDLDRKSTRLNSSHGYISYAVFCLKNKTP